MLNTETEICKKWEKDSFIFFTLVLNAIFITILYFISKSNDINWSFIICTSVCLVESFRRFYLYKIHSSKKENNIADELRQDTAIFFFIGGYLLIDNLNFLEPLFPVLCFLLFLVMSWGLKQRLFSGALVKAITLSLILFILILGLVFLFFAK